MHLKKPLNLENETGKVAYVCQDLLSYFNSQNYSESYQWSQTWLNMATLHIYWEVIEVSAYDIQ